jgi:hypothetical protein
LEHLEVSEFLEKTFISIRTLKFPKKIFKNFRKFGITEFDARSIERCQRQED